MSATADNRTTAWETCPHKFAPWFGPVLRCSKCGASTMATMDPRESKPIFGPSSYDGTTKGSA